MIVQEFMKRTLINAPAAEVFDWHMRPGAFDLLTPPEEKVKVIERPPSLDPGARLVMEMRVGPFRRRWIAEHTALEPGRMFRDIQRSGPFALWEHTHLMEPDADPTRCWLEDRVRYALPLGRLGAFFGSRYARAKMDKLFAYRHAVTKRECERP